MIKRLIPWLLLCGLAHAANPVPQLDWGVPIDIADFGACDATVTTGDSDWAKVNNSSNTVVCIDTGDHTGKGIMDITDGGFAGSDISISAVTLNDPVRVDFSSTHDWATDDIIFCDANAGGTWQLRWRYFKVTVVDADTVDLQGEDGSGGGLQPAWDAYTTGGTCKEINFKVIRHATNLSTHPRLLAGASKAEIDAFDCDESLTTADDDYILVWGLSVLDHAAENSQNNINGGGCDHFVIAYNEFQSDTSVPSNFVVIRNGSDYSVFQDNTCELNTTSATQEANCVAYLDGVDGQRFVRNEVWDMTAHSLTTIGNDFEGTVIAGNGLYTTTDMYADCDGTPNASGICACTEKAVEIKESTRGSRITAKDQIYRVEANMIFGFRKTVNEDTCSGVSSNIGSAVGTALGDEKANVLVLNNVIWDMQSGITHSGATGNDIKNWSIIGNIFYDINNPKNASSSSWGDRSVVFNHYADASPDHSVNEWAMNTIVNADHWMVGRTWQTGDFTCNVMIDAGSSSGDSGLTMDQNYVYGDTTGETAGDTDGGVTANANMADLTVQPYIITAPTTDVTLPDVLSTSSSPHIADCSSVGSSGNGVSDETVTF